MLLPYTLIGYDSCFPNRDMTISVTGASWLSGYLTVVMRFWIQVSIFVLTHISQFQIINSPNPPPSWLYKNVDQDNTGHELFMIIIWLVGGILFCDRMSAPPLVSVVGHMIAECSTYLCGSNMLGTSFAIHRVNPHPFSFMIIRCWRDPCFSPFIISLQFLYLIHTSGCSQSYPSHHIFVLYLKKNKGFSFSVKVCVVRECLSYGEG